MKMLEQIGWGGLEMPRVNVRGVKIYVSKGKQYAYHRLTGTRLEQPVGTPEFFAELAGIAAAAAKPLERPGTWGALVKAYRESPRFLEELKPRTRRDYNTVLDWLAGMAPMPLEQLTRSFVVQARDKAQAEKGRRFANYVLSVFSLVCNWGLERGLLEQNPARSIKKIRRPKDLPPRNRPWTRAEWSVVVARAPTHLLAPILLGGLLGWREGEILGALRDVYDRDGRTISRISSKGGRLVKTPMPKEVARAIDALYPHDSTHLLVSSRKRPWTQNGFCSSFFKFIRALEAAGLVGKGLTFHGLRHTRATRLREAGYDLRTIADFLGQSTEGMAGHYAREADLEQKLKGVVQAIGLENRKRPQVSNKRSGVSNRSRAGS